MNTNPIHPKDFIEEGVYVGNIFDFVKEDNVSELYDNIKSLQNFAKNNTKSIRCRYQYYPGDKNYEDSISMDKVEARNQFVKDNNLNIWQRWYEFTATNQLNNYFRNIAFDIVNGMYPANNYKITDFKNNSNFTMYLDGDMICPHRDGLNPGRICGLIVYLTPETEYIDGGGELTIVTNNKNEYEVKPVLGNFSLLEFTHSNINHGVNPVKNGFVRFAHTTFFELNENN